VRSSTFKDVLVIKLFSRLTACFKGRAGKRVTAHPAFAPARAEQRLAWLPRNRLIEPLDLPPPEYPATGLLDARLHPRYSAFMAQVVNLPAPLADTPLRDAGRHLASELLGQAITLGSSKGTDNSDEIYWLVQSAAIASLFADGAQSAAFAGYRQHVEYYAGAPRMAAQVEAFDRYVAADGQPAEDSELLSRSADDHYRIMIRPWEAGNTHWVYSPRIIDTRQGTCLLRFEDARWSTDLSTWRTASTVELLLSKYPGGQPCPQVKVIIDCAKRCARLDEGGEMELTELENVIDARLASN